MFNYLDLLSVPYKEGGRGPEFLDCYGMLRECYLRDWNIEIEDYPTRDSREKNIMIMHDAAMNDWVKVPARTPRCAVTLLVAGYAHIGYMINENDFIHTLDKHGPGIDPVRSLRWKNQVTGFYQWKALLATF